MAGATIHGDRDHHPHLDFDLLGAQIEACHEIGVECPIYYTVGGRRTTLRRTDWCARHKDGSFIYGGAIPEQSPLIPIRLATGSYYAPAALPPR